MMIPPIVLGLLTRRFAAIGGLLVTVIGMVFASVTMLNERRKETKHTLENVEISKRIDNEISELDDRAIIRRASRWVRD